MSETPNKESSVPLGKSGIYVPPLGTGTWQWGDRTLWGYGRGYQAEDVQAAFDASLKAGINFFDTAEVYGVGRSERFLGNFLPSTEERVVVATKFMPLPWRLTKTALRRALRGSLKRLGLQRVDLYQLHWPFPPVSIETWADALADAVEAGLTSAVGVSNYNEEQMRRAYAIMAKRGIPLATNQVEYNLLNRRVEFEGLLNACQELGITLIAYSPLAKGALTGKYSPENLPPGTRSRRYNQELFTRIQPLIRRMRQIASQNGEKTLAQVALNWLICKGALPIPGAKNARQVIDNAGALGWHLNAEEVADLDELSERISKPQ